MWRLERFHPIAHLDGDDCLQPVEPASIIRIDGGRLLGVRRRPRDNRHDILNTQPIHACWQSR